MGFTMVVILLLLCTFLSTVTGDGERFREKRTVTGSGRSCKDKFERIGTHSACLPKSSKLLKSGISESDRLLILNTHNDYRSKVRPAAANMMKMRWDDEIAKVAQGWAENCHYDHDKERSIPGRFSVGQNLASGYKDWQAAIDAWYIEKDQFTFGNKAANTVLDIGHYTQMVWATSTRLGCAYAECSNVRKYYVCNYGPAGNIGDFSKPYALGSSRCGQKYSKNNLCDCGQDCLNGGSWNLADCTCSCRNNYVFYTGTECNLDCGKADKNEPGQCGTQEGFDVAGCKKFENVPYDCPVLCNVCPLEPDNGEENEIGGVTCVNTHGVSSVLVAMLLVLAFILKGT